jgi:hypothetical protein
VNNDIIVSREKHLAEKVVFVDGLPGSGKSLFSPIIASMDRVELLNYTYEIEHICALKYLSKISMDAAEVMVRMQTDLKIYNTMMGREVNFRPTDVSSATQNHDPIRYFKRLFEVGDEAIPELIHRDRPILNLTTHQLLAFSEPIWRGLGARCVFIEILRHPLYMFRQQLWNEEKSFGSARSFDVYMSYKGHEVPYYALGMEEKYINLPAEERVINYFLHITELTNNARKKMLMDYDATIVTIPFEEFVISPEKWVDKITVALGTKPTEYTNNAMKKQNVPRTKIAQSVDVPVYRRCGWVPPIDGASERDELLNRRRDIVQKVSSEAMGILDQLCGDYEDKYWSPD